MCKKYRIVCTSSLKLLLKVMTRYERKLLNKFIDVIKIIDITNKSRTEVKRITDIFRGNIIDIGKQVYTVQLTGNAEKLNAFISVLQHETEIIESARSGCVGMARGDKALRI
jgi:acetolactate synthase-1/3 small subunit